MDLILEMLQGANLSGDAEVVGLLLLLLSILGLAYVGIRIRAGRSYTLRPLPGLDDLSGFVGHSAETGQPVHVSPGVKGLFNEFAVETWAGLAVLARLAEEAAACDTHLIVTVADPTVLPLAQEILRRACERQGRPEAYDPTHVRLVAPDPTAYAVGVMGMLRRESVSGNVMIGSFGREYLLMGEAGAQEATHQVVGTTDPQTLPLMRITADHTLIGEEVLTTPVYTGRQPFQVGSLLVQDWLRWVVVGAIVAGFVAKALVF
jgi:hypothetical protein